MSDSAKSREGLALFLFLIALILGSIWNGAGGGIDSFQHIWASFTESGPQNFSMRLEKLFHIPPPLKFPPPKIIPPESIVESQEILKKLPGPLPELLKLGGENKANPFFVQWVQDLLREGDVSSETPVVTSSTGERYEEDNYIFTGIVKIKDEPPAAVIRDVRKQTSVFLKEGDEYGLIKALKVELDGATITANKKKISFDTIHSSSKTFTIRRLVK